MPILHSNLQLASCRLIPTHHKRALAFDSDSVPRPRSIHHVEQRPHFHSYEAGNQTPDRLELERTQGVRVNGGTLTRTSRGKNARALLVTSTAMYSQTLLRVETGKPKSKLVTAAQDNDSLDDAYLAIRADNADELRAYLEKYRPRSAGSPGQTNRTLSGKTREQHENARLTRLFEYAKQNHSHKCLSYLRERYAWAESMASSSAPFLPKIRTPSPQHKARVKYWSSSQQPDSYKNLNIPSAKSKQRFKNQKQQLQRRTKAFKSFYFARKIASRMPASERKLMALQSACDNGKLTAVRDILVSLVKTSAESQPTNSKLISALSCTNELRETPLHISCRRGHTSIVEQLLTAIAKIQDDQTKMRLVQAADFNGYTSLHRAAQHGHAGHG